ncbi:MAG: hypothetical protein LUD22_00090 [Coprobacillus sp.]|nr:hypothetical protein [Coprobacillus sp.]
MKGTKLLTSVAALALVLSVGGCSTEETLPEPSEVVATDPAELVEKASTYGNYTVEIEYDLLQSAGSISYTDYILASYGDADALEKYYALFDDVVLVDTLVWYIYYDTDYIYIEAYEVVNDVTYFDYIDIIVNTSEGIWEYYTEDGEAWYYISPDSYLLYYGASKWQDLYSSLFDAADSEVLDHLQYYQTYDYYDFDDWKYDYYGGYTWEVSASAAEWFCDLGGEFLYSSYAYTYAYYYFLHYYTVFLEEYQLLESLYSYGYMDYTDYTYANVYYGEQDIYFDVYDVGTTDVRETVDYYHDYFQTGLNG